MAEATLSAKPGHILYIIPCPQDPEQPGTASASFLLDIPLCDLEDLVYRPIRWMRLVAWGILNCTGDVLNDEGARQSLDLHHSQLTDGAVFKFAPVANTNRFHLLNFEHARTKCSKISSRSSEVASSCSDSAPAERAQVLESRDGNDCVFSGRPSPEKAHIIPEAFSKNGPALRQLAAERNFGFDHHLDHCNTLSIIHSMHTAWARTRQGFVLATNDDFIRDEDVPPPHGTAPARDTWLARPVTTGVTYIWQAPRRVVAGHVWLDSVRYNERARFLELRPEWRPSATAINYMYAAGMVKLYLRENEPVNALLSRAVPVLPPADDDPSDETSDFEQSKRPHKKQKGNSYHGVGRLTRHERPVTRSKTTKRLHTSTDISPVELLNILAHAPAYLKQYEQRREQEEEKAQRLDDWLESSAAVYVP